MPWKKETPMIALRKEFVSLADQDNANISQLCARFGISRKTGYKWLRRWKKHGDKGLRDRSKRPKHSPNKTPPHIEQQVIAIHERYPEWGSRKLRQRIKRMIADKQLDMKLADLPASSTILAILKRHGRWEPHVYGPNEERSTQRFERKAPNQLWQMDFKGEFTLINQQLCYPLTIIDDHSRFNIALHACANMKRVTVTEVLRASFRRYGLPEAMLMDNGNPWGDTLNSSKGQPCYTQISVWLMRLGITVIFSRPGHPQTHGKNERYNGTLKAELLRYQSFRDLQQAQQRFDQWRNRYNLERPHQGIDDQIPIDRYQHSPRSYPKQLPAVEYEPHAETRKVSRSGEISYHATNYHVGNAFAGFEVAIRSHSTTHNMVYFCNHPILKIPID